MHKLSVLEMNRLSLKEFREAEKIPLVIILDNIRSMYNIGSVFRTADGFRVQKICLCGITATPPHQEIHKTALGAEDSIAWEYYPDVLDCISQLREQGYIIVSVEQVKDSHNMLQWEEQRPVALIFGNEVKGVSQEAVDKSDYCLEIPQYGTKHSFNVSCTASMVMWEFFKHQRLALRLEE